MSNEILSVKNIRKIYESSGGGFGRKNTVSALDGVSFNLVQGETLGIVGESGCGKSTLGRIISRLDSPTAGEIIYKGNDIAKKSLAEMRPLRKEIQFIFQDPYASLNPRMTVRQIVAEPLIVHGMAKDDSDPQVDEMIELCGLSREFGNRYPHEFSGGQRQRVGIARALVTRPKLVVLDEPVSALDVSVQAQILNLLDDLREKFGFSYLFVAHDLSVVSHISARVAVMYLGKIVEIGTREEIFNNPKHPYTKALISAVPLANPKLERIRKTSRIVLTGDVPSPANPPSGCRFRTRCWKAQEACTTTEPLLVTSGDHQVACHFPEK
mgnify:CR=1 FL=1